jgi:hypothetical protein
MGITVATSLIPGRDIDLQAGALGSWQRCGIDVLSVNAATEITDLRRQFPGLPIHAAARTGEKVAGKPVPFIRDLLLGAAANAKPPATVGLVNSDIFLRPVAGLAEALAHHSREALLLVPRVDVSDRGAISAFRPTGAEVFSVGYDGVFLPAALVEDIPENIFCIGMPFWDYWLPLVALLKGYPLKTLTSPIALHVAHGTRWDGSVYIFFHALVSDLLTLSEKLKPRNPSPAFHLAIDLLGHVYRDMFERGTTAARENQSTEALAAFYDRVQEVIVHHIKVAAVPVTIPGAGAAA